MASYIELILLFALPFVVLPFGLSPYEVPKVFVAEALIISLAFFSVWDGSAVRIFRKNALTYGLLGIAALALLQSIIFPGNLVWFGNAARFQGSFLYILLVFWALTSAHIHTRNTGVLSIFTLVLLGATAFIFPSTIDGRAVSLIGEPNAFAAEILFLWPLTLLIEMPKHWKHAVRIAVFVLTVILIAVSGSRSAWVGLFIQGFILLLSEKIALKKGAIIGAVILGISFVLPFKESVSVLDSRSEIWQTAYHAGLAHPVIGGGIGSVQLQLAGSALTLQNGLRFNYVDSSHNIFLDWWVQGGIVGLGLLLFVLTGTIIQFVKRREILYLTMLFGLLASLSFNPASIVSLVALWWLIGKAV